MQNADIIIIGSGAAGLTAALRAATGGLRTLVLEKTDFVGGTSAMSGAAAWIPANHHCRAAGVSDSAEEALAYLRATAPEGWRESEDALWAAMTHHAGPMLEFVEANAPLRFELNPSSDVYVEAEGSKTFGRMVGPVPLSLRMLGPWRRRLRRSTLPHFFTDQEMAKNDLYRKPFRTVWNLAPKIAGRLLTGTRGWGSALVAGLLKGCLDAGCTVELRARVVALLPDAAGTGVAGVVVEQDGRRRTIAARYILVASGGFEWNEALRRQYFPGPTDRVGSSPGNEGDAVMLGKAIGAELAHMDQALMYPCLPTRYQGRTLGLPQAIQLEPHALLVDRHGKRFVNEYNIDLGEALDCRDPATGEPLHLPVHLVSDRRFLRLALRIKARHDPSWLVKAPTVEALAAKIDLDPAALAATVERFNALARAGQDTDFHRGETYYQKAKTKGRPAMAAIGEAPFVAVSFNRAFLSTKGGLRTDARARVLRPDGTSITGLYAAGAAMANPIGTRAVSSGSTIGPNMTWGYIAALDALGNG